MAASIARAPAPSRNGSSAIGAPAIEAAAVAHARRAWRRNSATVGGAGSTAGSCVGTATVVAAAVGGADWLGAGGDDVHATRTIRTRTGRRRMRPWCRTPPRSEEHTSELQSRQYLVCSLLLEKKKNK